MSTQPEALRLADALEHGSYLLSVERNATAAELRRLAAENESLKAERNEDRRRDYGYSQQVVDALTKERDVLHAQRDALLEALKWYVETDEVDDAPGNEFWIEGRDRARAAIKAAEEGK